jgi:hypothetical protein
MLCHDRRMRWYFGIDEAGSEGALGYHARLAVLSARLADGLEPRLLYFGARNHFTLWMQDHGVMVIDAEPPGLDAMREATRQGRFQGHSIGHWLRLAIPHIDRDADYVLYTDCDIVFRRRLDFSRLTPGVFAAAPEFAPDVWNYFNSGVMLMNMNAMRATAAALETLLRDWLNAPDAAPFDDQIALNHAYQGYWEKLDPAFNWKPYWPFNPQAAVLHFHGPKLPVIEAIADGRWHAKDPTAQTMTALLNGHLSCYAAWLANLGDLLQLTDISWALDIQRIAAKLAAYAETNPLADDLSFMKFQMFWRQQPDKH